MTDKTETTVESQNATREKEIEVNTEEKKEEEKEPEEETAPPISSGQRPPILGVSISEENEAEVPTEKSKKSLYVTLIVFLVLFLGVVAGFFYFRSRRVKEKTELTETKTEEMTPTSTPTPSFLSREEISLEILNGSGVVGAAGETASIFEVLGYEIVGVGNTDETEGNQLYVDADLEGLLDQLLEDVKDELDISSISGELTDSTASARIILGQ